MKLKKQKVLLGVLMLTPIVAGIQNASAVPVDGGTLDPTTIPKYVTPLVIPPVMRATGTEPDPEFGGTRDVYDIAVRQFQQQILPGGIWAGLPGCDPDDNDNDNDIVIDSNNNNDNDNVCTFPPTTVWGYGPATDLLPDSTDLGGAAGVAPAANSQFNYPAYTVESIKDRTTSIHWINGLTDNAWALDPDNKGNALPHLFAVDQSLHWSNPVADCKGGELRTDCMGTTDQPYLGPVSMVTHLHGAHAASAGDGYTEAWWLPDADNINCVDRDVNGVPIFPEDVDGNLLQGLQPDGTWNVVCEGTMANQLTNRQGDVVPNTNNLDPDDPRGLGQGQGVATFRYHNDQPSATLWYHDHSLGTTRLNVYAGPAGFYLVREADGGETGLIDSILPSPAPVAGEDLIVTNVDERHKYREIPIVIQGRSFNDDGSLFYPDNRAFFEGLNVAGTEAAGTSQFPVGTGELRIDMDPATSDIAPIWNPEAFFNTMVVNGLTWPKLEVAPALYRFRLLNGSNSRFINLALPVTNAAGKQISVKRTVSIYEKDGRSKKPKKYKVNELRFWQIGAEQSLSPTVTAVRTGFATSDLQQKRNGKFRKETRTASPQQALLMGLAERADVIVDFRGLPNGTIITMTNTAPDSPFGGFPDVPADPDTTGQVMRFVVNNDLLGESPTDELHPVKGQKFTYVDKKGRTRTRKAGKQDLSTVLNPDTAATSPWNIAVDPLALDNFTVAVTNPTDRELALVEEESELICADVDLDGNVVQLTDYTPVAGACEDEFGNIHPTALPFAPKAAVLGTVDVAGVPTVTLWSDPIVTNVNADGSGTQTAEQWNLWNFTVDGHPIHVHLVKFRVLERAAIGGGASIVSDKKNRNLGVQPWENGWKDTVITYPGEVTTIAADFDINGLYVWHCHIVEHEDNEMMVPMCVGVAGVDCPTSLF